MEAIEHRRATIRLLREFIDGSNGVAVAPPKPAPAAPHREDGMDLDAPPAPSLAVPPEFALASDLGAQLRRRSEALHALNEVYSSSIPNVSSSGAVDAQRGFLPRVAHEPMRRRVHWDALLAEAQWAASDVHLERRWKITAAAALAHAVAAHVKSKQGQARDAMELDQGGEQERQLQSARPSATRAPSATHVHIPPAPAPSHEPQRVRALLASLAPLAVTHATNARALVAATCVSRPADVTHSITSEDAAARAWGVAVRVALAHTCVYGRSMAAVEDEAAHAAEALETFRHSPSQGEVTGDMSILRTLDSPVALARIAGVLAAATRVWTRAAAFACNHTHSTASSTPSAASRAVLTALTAWALHAPVVVSGSYIHAGAGRTSLMTDVLHAWMIQRVWEATGQFGTWSRGGASAPQRHVACIILTSGVCVANWARAWGRSVNGAASSHVTAFGAGVHTLDLNSLVLHDGSRVAFRCVFVAVEPLVAAGAGAETVTVAAATAGSSVCAVVADTRAMTPTHTARALDWMGALTASHACVAGVLLHAQVPVEIGLPYPQPAAPPAPGASRPVVSAAYESCVHDTVAALLRTRPCDGVRAWVTAAATAEAPASLTRALAYLACICIPLRVLHTPTARTALTYAPFRAASADSLSGTMAATQLLLWMRDSPTAAAPPLQKTHALKRRVISVPLSNSQREMHAHVMRSLAYALDDLAFNSIIKFTAPASAPTTPVYVRMEGAYTHLVRSRLCPVTPVTAHVRPNNDKSFSACLSMLIGRLRLQLNKVMQGCSASVAGGSVPVNPSALPDLLHAAFTTLSASMCLLHAALCHASLLDSLFAHGCGSASTDDAEFVVSNIAAAALRTHITNTSPPAGQNMWNSSPNDLIHSTRMPPEVGTLLGLHTGTRASDALALYTHAPVRLTVSTRSVPHEWQASLHRWVRRLAPAALSLPQTLHHLPQLVGVCIPSGHNTPVWNSVTMTSAAKAGAALPAFSKSRLLIPPSPLLVGLGATHAHVGGRKCSHKHRYVYTPPEIGGTRISLRTTNVPRVLFMTSAPATALLPASSRAAVAVVQAPYIHDELLSSSAAIHLSASHLCAASGKMSALRAVLDEALALNKRVLVLAHMPDSQRLVEALCTSLRVSCASISLLPTSTTPLDDTTLRAAADASLPLAQRLRLLGCVAMDDARAAARARVVCVHAQMPAWADAILAHTEASPVLQAPLVTYLCEAVLGALVPTLCAHTPIEHIVYFDTHVSTPIAQVVLAALPQEKVAAGGVLPAVSHTVIAESNAAATDAVRSGTVHDTLHLRTRAHAYAAARVLWLSSAVQCHIVRALADAAMHRNSSVYVLSMVTAGTLEDVGDLWHSVRPEILVALMAASAVPIPLTDIQAGVLPLLAALRAEEYGADARAPPAAPVPPRGGDLGLIPALAGLKRRRDAAAQDRDESKLLQALVYPIPYDDDVDAGVARKQARIRGSGLTAAADAELTSYAMRSFHGTRKVMGSVLAGVSLLSAHQDVGILHYSHIFGPPHVDHKFVTAPPACSSDPAVTFAARLVMTNVDKVEVFDDGVTMNAPPPARTGASSAHERGQKAWSVASGVVTTATRDMPASAIIAANWEKQLKPPSNLNTVDRRAAFSSEEATIGHSMPLTTEEAEQDRTLRRLGLLPSFDGGFIIMPSLMTAATTLRTCWDTSRLTHSALQSMLQHARSLVRYRSYSVSVTASGLRMLPRAMPASQSQMDMYVAATTTLTAGSDSKPSLGVPPAAAAPYAEDSGILISRSATILGLAEQHRGTCFLAGARDRKRAYLSIMGFQLPSLTMLTAGVIFTQLADSPPPAPAHTHMLRFARARLALSRPAATPQPAALDVPVPAPEGNAPNSVHVREDWTATEDTLLLRAVSEFGTNWDICREVMRAASLTMPPSSDAFIFRTGPTAALAAPLRARPYRSARQCFDRYRRLSSRTLHVYASTAAMQPGRTEASWKLQPRVLVSSVTPIPANRRFARLAGSGLVGIYHDSTSTAVPAPCLDVLSQTSLAAAAALPAAATRPRYAMRQSEKINAFTELRKRRAPSMQLSLDPATPIAPAEASHAAAAAAASSALYTEASALAVEASAAGAAAGAPSSVPVPTVPTTIVPLLQLSKLLPAGMVVPPSVFTSLPGVPSIASHYAPHTEPFRKTSPYILSLRAKERERNKLQQEAHAAALATRARNEQQRQAAAAAAAAAAAHSGLDAGHLMHRLLGMEALRSLGISEEQLRGVLMPLLDDQLLVAIDSEFNRTDISPQTKDDNVAALLVNRLQSGGMLPS